MLLAYCSMHCWVEGALLALLALLDDPQPASARPVPVRARAARPRRGGSSSSLPRYPLFGQLVFGSSSALVCKAL